MKITVFIVNTTEPKEKKNRQEINFVRLLHIITDNVNFL